MSLEEKAEQLAEDIWTSIRKYHNECRPSGDKTCPDLPMWIELDKDRRLAYCVYFTDILRDLIDLSHYVVDGDFLIVPVPPEKSKPENN